MLTVYLHAIPSQATILLMFASLFEFLRRFHAISDIDQALIEQELHYRAMVEDDYLIREGEVCQQMFFICKGILRNVAQNEKGSELTVLLLERKPTLHYSA